VVLFVGCGAPTQQPAATRPDPASAGATAPAPVKTINLGIQREPATLDQGITGGGSLTAGGASNVPRMLHDYLSVPTGLEGYEARLAAEMPTIEKGTWQVNTDGTMDMTWKLRPNVKWHDGAPFTSADLVFSFDARRALGVRTEGGGRPELMESVSAPDPLTFVVHWSSVYVRANEATGLDPLPTHLLLETFRTDKESLPTNRYFTTEFVGLGAYRLARWDQGSAMELARFDDYFLGRPPVDRIIVRFISDPNALVASILGDSLDVILTDSIDSATALDVRSRWEGTGNQVTFFTQGGLHQLEMQHRPEYARPVNGFTNRTVRQALYSAIDRKTFAEVLTGGVGPAADSWYAPDHPLRRELESSIPQFPHDISRAQQMLAQAGWTRGADGVLVDSQTGERFETAIMAKSTSATERALNVIADGWKQVGVQTTFDVLTPANQDDRQYQSTRPGPYFTSPSGVNFYDNRLHTNAMTRPENRWTGTNRGGYNNPKVDVLLDRLAVTIEPSARLQLHKDLLSEQMVDIALMPLVWEVLPILMRKGITGPKIETNEGTRHIYEWNKQ
jgi:peptide/nickel transport system substrate-binding protein